MFIIADLQDISRYGMHQILSTQMGTQEQITDVSNKRQLAAAIETDPKAVVILDYSLFDLSNVEELIIYRERFPQVRWVLFSDSLSEPFVRRIGVEDAFSIVLKDCSVNEILAAVRCAVEGSRFYCHQITNMLLSNRHQPTEDDNLLTQTEKEVLKLMALGKSTKEIAAVRVSSIHTIITHRKNIFRKIEVNNVYEATKYALRAGLIDQAEYYI